MPNGTSIASTASTTLNIPSLDPNSQTAYICPALQPHSLISIGQLCDAGCEANFTSQTVVVQHNKQPILHGRRHPETNLWHMDVPVTTQDKTPAPHSANLINQSTSPAKLVRYAHAALFSPSISTLQKALDNNFIVDFPGLNAQSLRLHPPQSAATIKGHLDQVRQHQNPSNHNQLPDTPKSTADTHCNQPAQQDPTQHCYVALHSMITATTGQVYTDQTGKFSTTSSKGNNYVLILYDYDSNSIHAHPLKTKSATEMVSTFTTIYKTLTAAGLKPKLHRLDNECSTLLKNFMTEENVKIQLIPPGIHRANAAERAIRTFKNHFIAGLASTDPDYPAHLWDLLLPQAVLTLNLLRASRSNPNISAYTHLHGQYLFTKTPIAPPGCHILVHQKPDKRPSWAPHALDAWYIGPALDHYRCFRAWMWETRAERITDTVSWLDKHIPTPTYTLTEQINDTAAQLTNLLQNIPVTANQPLTLQPTHTQELRNIATILGTISRPTLPPPSNWPIPPINNVDLPEGIDNTVVPIANPVPGEVLRVPPAPDNSTPPIEPLGLTITDSNTRRTHRVSQPSRRFLESINQCVSQTLPTTNHYSASAVNCDTGVLTEYAQLLRTTDGPRWEASAVEWARLAQGCPLANITAKEGTNTLFFIHHHEMPPGRIATYPRIVVADRPQKANPRRVRVTVGGDRIDYPGQVATKTAGMATVKILFNSIISTPKAKFMSIDIKDFYLNTPMERAEFMKVDIKLLPKLIIEHYNLRTKLHNNGIYTKIVKGMYGLPQAGILANTELVHYLNTNGYHQCANTPGLFTHENRPIAFCLIVDDFAVKYVGAEHAQHLINTLQKQYSITIDWTGTLYIGLTLNWQYEQGTVDISMPTYVEKALQRFQHPPPKRPQYAPYAWSQPVYGAKTQYAPEPDSSPLLNAKQVKRLQQVIGVFLYYARAVDSSMLVALGSLAAVQTQATEKTNLAFTQFLDYATTNPIAIVRYRASPMVLHVHSDASYLSEAQARSRAGGIFFFSPTNSQSDLNGAVHITSNIMKPVLGSAAEAEVAALYYNAQEACPMQVILNTLRHKQPPTPMQTDNKCACGILNATVKQKRTKSIDMNFYWLSDRVERGQFSITWAPGTANHGDYFTKHHPPKHHQLQRTIYFQTTEPKDEVS